MDYGLVVDPEQAAWWLDESLVLTRGGERVLEHLVCCLEHRIDLRVVLMNHLEALDIRVRARWALAGSEERIGVGLLVQDGRAIAQRLLWVEHRE